MNESSSFNPDALKPLLSDDFVLGVGTAAYQIEGAAGHDGRTQSVWDTFSHLPGKIADQSSGDVACDHYHRWQEDVELLADLGVDVYRFSVSWSRVFPTDSQVINPRGLEFYQRLIEALHQRGIRPMVTLHHWDLPQYLQDQGGWQNRATALRFAEFSSAIAQSFGASVNFYTTINEPWSIVHFGHRLGIHAPGISDENAASAATHHLLLAHGLATEALRAHAPGSDVGIVLNGGPSYPLSESEADKAAAKHVESEQIHRFVKPLLHGTYPDEFTALVSDYVLPGDLEIIAQPCDYLGWNYYSRNVVKRGTSGRAETVVGRDYPTTDMDWEIFPEGLREICSILVNDYDAPPLYVCENGAAFQDKVIGNNIRDPKRIDYIQRHLEVVAEMIESGMDIRGYICWTLLDNFEWAEGYSKRFGIVHVDFDTQTRTLKDSAKAFARLNAVKAKRTGDIGEKP